MEAEFDRFWAEYPRKRGKKAAHKAFMKARKQFSFEAIMASLRLMVTVEWRTRKPEFVPYPATYLTGEAFDSEHGEMPEEEEPLRFGHHVCTVCQPPHEWDETGDPINWAKNGDRTCAEQRAKMRQAISKAKP